jgi:hypothetical protein
MTESIPDSGRTLSKLRVAAIALFAVLNVAVFLVRALSVWKYGDMFSTGSGEFLVEYAVWKGMHHLPVYELALNYPFSLALYNFLTYKLYAFVLSSIGAWDGGILVWGRYLTALFAVVGAVAQWRLMQDRLKLRGPLSLLSLLFALGMWISTSMMHYWALTVRPDLPAVAMVMIALGLVVRQPRFGFALAAVFFYLAWAFKQSVVLTLAAVCLWLLFHKRWRPLFVLASVFFVLTAATLLLGTSEYRFDVLTAPRLIKSAFSLPILWRAAGRPVLTNLYWLVAPVALLLAAGRRRMDSTVRLATTVLVLALLGGLAGMGTTGGAENYLFEAFVAGSILFQIAAFSVPTRLVSSLLLIGCVQPALQLAVIPLGRDIFGTVRLATASQYANAQAVQAELATLRKPIFTPDQTFSLPWFSSGDQAPALVIDHLFQEGAAQRLERGGLVGLLRRGDIPTVILDRGSKYEKDLNPCYTKTGAYLHQGVPYDQDIPYDIYSIEKPAAVQAIPAK